MDWQKLLLATGAVAAAIAGVTERTGSTSEITGYAEQLRINAEACDDRLSEECDRCSQP